MVPINRKVLIKCILGYNEEEHRLCGVLFLDKKRLHVCV